MVGENIGAKRIGNSGGINWAHSLFALLYWEFMRIILKILVEITAL